MEKEGFKRVVNRLLHAKIPVRVISTDRHVSIKKMMTEVPYNAILHQFDAWHVAKGVLKKMMAAANASKKKDSKYLLFLS